MIDFGFVRVVSARCAHRVFAIGIATAGIWLLASTPALAQTDFRNLDRGRPLTIEDAIAVEEYGMELHLSPLRLERGSGGAYRWGAEPAIEVSILPRTHVELALPFALADSPAGAVSALAGIAIGVFHQLNSESLTLPAMALRLDALLPAGGFGPARTYTTVGALATRSFDEGLRAHVNANWTIGDATSGAGGAAAAAGAREITRWTAGVAVDRTFVLESLLVGAEFVLRQPITPGASKDWSVGAGARMQLDPRWVLDLGLGRRTSDTDASWYATVGGAYALGWRWMSVGGGH